MSEKRPPMSHLFKGRTSTGQRRSGSSCSRRNESTSREVLGWSTPTEVYNALIANHLLTASCNSQSRNQESCDGGRDRLRIAYIRGSVIVKIMRHMTATISSRLSIIAANVMPVIASRAAATRVHFLVLRRERTVILTSPLPELPGYHKGTNNENCSPSS